MPNRYLTALRAALVAVGLVALALYPLFHWWPSGFRWQPPQPEYEQMLAALYATLGVFLLRAARAPLISSEIRRTRSVERRTSTLAMMRARASRAVSRPIPIWSAAI